MLRSPKATENGFKMTEISVDDVFRKIGQFGRRQKIYFFIIGLVSVFAGLHVFATTFVDYTPGWNCGEGATSKDNVKTCASVEEGHCTVQYDKDSPETTVTEVGVKISTLLRLFKSWRSIYVDTKKLMLTVAILFLLSPKL